MIIHKPYDGELEGFKNLHLHHMFLLPPFGEVAIYLHVELLKLFLLISSLHYNL